MTPNHYLPRSIASYTTHTTRRVLSHLFYTNVSVKNPFLASIFSPEVVLVVFSPFSRLKATSWWLKVVLTT